jgi:osomolarity two-component system response regulator SKN7
LPIISSSSTSAAVSAMNTSSSTWAEQPLENLLTDIFLPTPHQGSIDTASVAAAAAQLNGSSLIGSSIKTSDGLTFLALGRLSNNKSDQQHQQHLQHQQHQQQQQHIHHQQQQQQQHLNHQQQHYNHPEQQQQQQQQQHHVLTETPILDKGKKKMMTSWTTPPRVLLVDDDSVYRDVSGRMLNMVGCSIDLAKDGLEALQKMSVEKYDLILMVNIMHQITYI